ADWLVCRETCIPEGADLTLTLPVAADATIDPRDGAALAAARASAPGALADTGWRASARGDGPHVAITLTPPAGAADPGDLRYFADDADRVEPAGAQVLEHRDGAYVLTVPCRASSPTTPRMASRASRAC